MIGRVTHHTIDLTVILTVRIGRQQLLTLTDHLAVFVLDKIDLRDVVERLLLELRMLFQAAEGCQRLWIASLRIVDVRHIVGRCLLVALANLGDACEIASRFL